MSEKSQTRVCKYAQCKHNGKINISTEPFVKEKNSYYHEDCYKEKTDLQLFRNLWHDNISSTVVYSQLNKILNQLISNNISSDYLLFVLQYIIKKRYKLNYPSGFRYYLDYPEIKETYKKIQAKKVLDKDSFSLKNKCSDNSPKFKVEQKGVSFANILKRKNG